MSTSCQSRSVSSASYYFGRTGLAAGVLPRPASNRLCQASVHRQAAEQCAASSSGRRSLAASAAAHAAAAPQAPQQPGASEWVQRVVELQPYNRGCHIITRRIYEAIPELDEFEVGLANLFIMHTSASLTINENASPDVPLDLNDSLDRIVPDGRHYRHLDEGLDDMPAHVKSSLMGASLTLPVSHGKFALGTWQGIYLNEHRNYGGPRRIVITVQGKRRADGRKYPKPWAV